MGRPVKPILDACCGGRMMWFDKNHPAVVFSDIRRERLTFTGGSRTVDINPDVIADFTKMPFDDKAFKLVVFDPPHSRAGKNGWMRKKYGSLRPGWQRMLQAGFNECMRVLDDYGVLIFKWNETQYPASQVLGLFPERPLFGHRTMVRNNTVWAAFMKMPGARSACVLCWNYGPNQKCDGCGRTTSSTSDDRKETQ
jgi:hypothetical protein